ncbi:hypothetical protein [Enterobacter asburiae]|uniref:hypothetical protein n=1 Tax=Enterobacter asburiae TaxID=61645 RepID=UPI002100275B|nr:hypothetical protein [Enterobacter asburiae]
MSNKYEDLIKNARMNADCGEHMSPEEVTTLLNVVETTFAALAAENAGLKESRKNLAEFIHEELDADYPLNMDIETPVTDVFLAEVRAQGVESFAESQKEYVRKNRNELDSMTRAAYCGSAVDAERFAALLRKGVQS